LNDTRYQDRTLSLTAGVVDPSQIPMRLDKASWFQDRHLLTDGRLWAEGRTDLKRETERSVFLDRRTLDLVQRVPPQSLGGMIVQLEKKLVIDKGLRRAFSTAGAGWLLPELPHALRRIVEIRNPMGQGTRNFRD
jgi:hypothetical protein